MENQTTATNIVQKKKKGFQLNLIKEVKIKILTHITI